MKNIVKEYTSIDFDSFKDDLQGAKSCKNINVEISSKIDSLGKILKIFEKRLSHSLYTHLCGRLSDRNFSFSKASY